VGQEYSALLHRKRQHFGIRHGGIRLSGIQRCQYVMPQPAQLLDDLQRKVFVRVETGHPYAVSFSRI
jgi:hypothetical protein